MESVTKKYIAHWSDGLPKQTESQKQAEDLYWSKCNKTTERTNKQSETMKSEFMYKELDEIMENDSEFEKLELTIAKQTKQLKITEGLVSEYNDSKFKKTKEFINKSGIKLQKDIDTISIKSCLAREEVINITETYSEAEFHLRLIERLGFSLYGKVTREQGLEITGDAQEYKDILKRLGVRIKDRLLLDDDFLIFRIEHEMDNAGAYYAGFDMSYIFWSCGLEINERDNSRVKECFEIAKKNYLKVIEVKKKNGYIKTIK